MKILLLLFFLMGASLVWAQPVIDGDLSDSDYVSVATKSNSNMGFGPDIDVSEIVYYSDPGTRIIYLGVKGKMNSASNDGIGIMLNLLNGVSPVGAPACTPLGWGLDAAGNVPGHYMSGNGGLNSFQADFEVDLMFALNPGVTATECYVDVTTLLGAVPISQYLGNCGQAGSPLTITDPTTGITISFAFFNGGTNGGFEISLDYSSTPFLPDDMEAFAFVTSATAFFSDVTVPGNVTGGNIGFDADFCTTTGGPYHSGVVPVPVELLYFEGEANREEAILTWATATEINSDYFEVERSANLSVWESIGAVQAAGNSMETNMYNFKDYHPKEGVNYYRLKQIDLDGSVVYSQVISLSFKENVNGNVFPNPVADIAFVQVEVPSILSVFDAAGRMVYSQAIQAGIHEVSLSEWQAGLYWIQAHSETGQELIKEVLIVE